MAYTISIVGCGWLGLPLGAFLKENGHTVKGSTTHADKISLLDAKGIRPFLLRLGGDENQGIAEEGIRDFFQCDILIISIPPKVSSTGEAHHPGQIKQLIANIKHCGIPKVIYISATSIYPKAGEVIDEETNVDDNNTGNKALYNAEQLLFKETVFQKNILRCGGLLGYERIPGKYFEGKMVENGFAPVNYIHRDDVIGVIDLLIRKNIWGKTYNLVAPSHPTRQEVFIKNAFDFDFDPPKFVSPLNSEKEYKLVIGDQLSRDLQYEFLYPNPLFFHYTP